MKHLHGCVFCVNFFYFTELLDCLCWDFDHNPESRVKSGSFWGVYVVGGVILPSVLLVCVCTLLLALAATPLFVGEPTTRMCVDHNNKGITTIVYLNFRSGLSWMVWWGWKCFELILHTWAKAERNTFRTHNCDTTLHSNVCCVVLCCVAMLGVPSL